MWLTFVFDVILALILLYLPGFLLCRSFRLSGIQSAVFAPVFSGLVLYVTSYGFLKLGISAPGWLIPTAVVLVSLFIRLGSFFVQCRKDAVSARGNKKTLRHSRDNWKVLFAYILFGMLIGAYVFVKTLDGAASFNQQYDNYAHLNTVRQFIDTGFYAPGGLFTYPYLWHCLVSLVASVGFGEVCIAANAVNYVIAAVVFPAAMYLFMSSVFKSNQVVVVCGIVCSVAFTEFPWGLLLFGPLYPNVLGYAVLPAVMTMFIVLLREESLRGTVKNLVLFIFGCVTLVFMHPNSIFAGIVLLAPFAIAQMARLSLLDRWDGKKKQRMSLFFAASFFALVLAVWSVLFRLPAFQSVVQFEWPAYLTFWNALSNGLLLSFTQYSAPQYVLAALVCVGVIYCFVKKTHKWLVVSYAVSLAILIVASSTEGALKHYLAGFWYTDTFRIAGMVALVGVPLASLGLSTLFCFVRRVFWKNESEVFAGEQRRALVGLLAVFALLVYFPNTNIVEQGEIETAFGVTSKKLLEYNSLSEEAVYSESEIQFIDKVKASVSDDAVIANVPFDGSFLSYGVNGLNVQYRALETAGYWDKTTDLEGKKIRANLCNYTTDEETYSAVKSCGVQYVLLLDKDDATGEKMYPCAKDMNFWKGLMEIQDDTPGFEVVLSEGDMRLYRLTEV